MISGGFIALEKGFDPVIRSQLEVLTDRIVTFDELKMSSKFDDIMSPGQSGSEGKGKIGKYLEELEKPDEEEQVQTEKSMKKEEEPAAEDKPTEETNVPPDEVESKTPEQPPAAEALKEDEAVPAAIPEEPAENEQQTVGRIGKMMQQLDEENHS